MTIYITVLPICYLKLLSFSVCLQYVSLLENESCEFSWYVVRLIFVSVRKNRNSDLSLFCLPRGAQMTVLLLIQLH
jgi:hypothetical protein